MTVIAYDKTHIAWDGRVCQGTDIYTNDAKKVRVVGATIYAFCGDYGLIEHAIAWHRGGARKARLPPEMIGDKVSWALLVITKKGAGVYSEDCPFYTMLKTPYAIGSGGQFARGALGSKANAYQACKVACQEDSACGGTIQIVKFEDVF